MFDWIRRGWRRRNGPTVMPRAVPITVVPVHLFERTVGTLPALVPLTARENRLIVVPGVGVVRLRFERAVAESANTAYWRVLGTEVLADNAETPAWDEVLARG